MKPCIRFFPHPENQLIEDSRLVAWDITKMVTGYVFDGVWGTVRKFLP